MLFVLPQSWTDAFIPMNIEPQPRKIVRVMVGRLEMLSADRAAEGRSRNRQPRLARFERHRAGLSVPARTGPLCRADHSSRGQDDQRRASQVALPPAAPHRLRDRPSRRDPQRERRKADERRPVAPSGTTGAVAAPGGSRCRSPFRGEGRAQGAWRPIPCPRARRSTTRPRRPRSRRRHSRPWATTARLPRPMPAVSS